MSGLQHLNEALGTDLEKLYLCTIETIADFRYPVWDGKTGWEARSLVRSTINRISELGDLLSDAGFTSGMSEDDFSERCQEMRRVPLTGKKQEQRQRMICFEILDEIRIRFNYLISDLERSADNPEPSFDKEQLSCFIKNARELRRFLKAVTGQNFPEVISGEDAAARQKRLIFKICESLKEYLKIGSPDEHPNRNITEADPIEEGSLLYDAVAEIEHFFERTPGNPPLPDEVRIPWIYLINKSRERNYDAYLYALDLLKAFERWQDEISDQPVYTLSL